MNFRPPRQDDVSIDLAPLIDVVFLLLIFFMISTTFIEQSEIELTLPEASESTIETAEDVIEVALDQAGRVFVNDRALVNAQLATIREALIQAKPGDVEATVVISADERATLQDVITIMDAARHAGLSKVTFPTRVEVDE